MFTILVNNIAYINIFFSDQFSEQQLVDCVFSDGCDGARPEDAWLYLAAIGGQNTLASYPYSSGTTQKVVINYKILINSCFDHLFL